MRWPVRRGQEQLPNLRHASFGLSSASPPRNRTDPQMKIAVLDDYLHLHLPRRAGISASISLRTSAQPCT
jgi:hypothetical protein